MGVSVVSSRGADFHSLIYATHEIYYFLLKTTLVTVDSFAFYVYLHHNYVIKIGLLI